MTWRCISLTISAVLHTNSYTCAHLTFSPRFSDQKLCKWLDLYVHPLLLDCTSGNVPKKWPETFYKETKRFASIVEDFFLWRIFKSHNKNANNLVLHPVAYAENFRGGGPKHRRSQGAKGAIPPKCLENIVILYFERRFSKKNSVIRLQLKIWDTLPNTVYTFFIFGIWGGMAQCPPPYASVYVCQNASKVFPFKMLAAIFPISHRLYRLIACHEQWAYGCTFSFEIVTTIL